MKSCSRVPTARITSAFSAILLAELEPVTPIGPILSGWVATRLARPAMVSTTGMLWVSAKAVSSATAPEYCTPPPAMIIGPLGGFQQRRRLGDLVGIRPDAADAVHRLLEEFQRIVVGPALNVLGQPQECGAAIRRIQHGGDRRRQRLDDLRRMGDPVPVAGHGFEGVVHAEAGIAEMLELLQHRIRQPRDIGVAAQHQHRQPVGVGQGRRGERGWRCRARPMRCRT